MLERIINSKTRLLILSYFFNNLDKKYYSRELAKLLNLDQANTYKELSNLVSGKFLNTEIREKRKYFYLNKDNLYFSDFKNIFVQYDLKNGDDFFCIEEMPNYYPLFVWPGWHMISARHFCDLYNFKASLKKLVCFYQNNLCQLITHKKAFSQLGQEVLERVKNDSSFRKQYIVDIRDREKKLYLASNDFKAINFSSKDNLSLAEIYENYFNVYHDLHKLHWGQTVLDFGDGALSKHLLSYLKPRAESAKFSLGDVFSILTTPTIDSQAAIEYKQLLHILEKINEKKEILDYFKNTESRIITDQLNELHPQIYQAIKEHAAKFGFLGYGTVGPSWSIDYFIDILGSLARQNINPRQALVDIEEKKRSLHKRQQELIAELKIDDNYADIFQFARDLVHTKGSRKDAMFLAISLFDFFYREIAKRLYLSIRQLRYLSPLELLDLLKGKEVDPHTLNQRYELGLHFSTDNKEDFLIGKKAKLFFSQLQIKQEDVSNVKLLQGDCAAPGRVRGVVKIINESKDMSKMQKGDILISIATTPDLMPAIKKAVAIITDVGGITCHAAIVSRELGIPCVVGTKVATKVLRDGDVIDVDATHGKVDIIKQEK
jgi:phosphohistidine swiveling domain-containing protein